MFIDRFRYFLGVLIAIPVFPIMYLQARKLKRDFPDLPEARNKEGKTDGTEALKVLMLGESSIAGVGVQDHQQGISGQLAKELSFLNGRAMEWKVVAKSGYTAKLIREKMVRRIPKQPFDLIVIGLGGNDTFKVNTPWFWKQSMHRLITDLHDKHPEAQIIITCMPPVHTFTAFPPLIRFFLGGLTKLLGREMRRLTPKYDYLYYFDYVVSVKEWLHRSGSDDRSVFFSDGVHPSALTYMLWAQDTARFIHTNVPINKS